MRINALIYAHLTVETEEKSRYRVHQSVRVRKKNMLNDDDFEARVVPPPSA